MAERNKLASIPGQPLPERKGNFLSDLWDEASGAFARYGRRSAAQRDASLALLNQAVDPNTDPLTGAGMKALGLAGLVTHPLAFFPTRDEWDQRLQAAGNDGRMSRSIGGFLSDLPSLIDPQMAAGGAALAAAPIVGKLGRGISDLAGDATDAELAALRARLQAEAAQTGGAPSSVSREQALQGLTGRAKAGGETGVNGYLYKGGQFLPSTDAPPGTFRIKTKGKSTTIPNGQELIAPGQVAARPTPFSKSIFQGMSGGSYVIIGDDGIARLNPKVNWEYIGTTPDTKAPLRFKNLAASKETYSINDLIDLYNSGARWVDLDPVDGVEIVARGDK